MKYKYCPDCGIKLSEKKAGDEGLVPFCDTCDKYWFDTFSNCVIVLIYNEYDEIVLSWQSYLSEEYATFTSGYIAPGETTEETAVREVKEELGLDIENLEYAGTHWFGAKDMLMHGFIGFAQKKEFTLSQEIDSAEWVHAYEAPKTMFPDRPGNSMHALYRQFLAQRNLYFIKVYENFWQKRI